MSDVVARIDDLGRPAWIALMVLGFILFWPVGLLILGYLLWSGRMGCGHGFADWQARQAERWERLGRQAVAELLEQPATQTLASPLNPAGEVDGGRRGFVRVSAAEAPVWTE